LYLYHQFAKTVIDSMRYQFRNCSQVLDILGSPEDTVKLNAPVDFGCQGSSCARRSCLHSQRVKALFFSPWSWWQRQKFRSIGMCETSAEQHRRVIFFQMIVGKMRWSEDWKYQILYAALLSNCTVLHFEMMKVSHSISFIIKVIAHFRQATLLSVGILTNISNCMPNSMEPFSTSD